MEILPQIPDKSLHRRRRHWAQGTQGPNGPWAGDPGSQWTLGQGQGPNGPWARDPGSQWTLGLGQGPNGPWAWARVPMDPGPGPGSLARSLAVVVAVASLIPPNNLN